MGCNESKPAAPAVICGRGTSLTEKGGNPFCVGNIAACGDGASLVDGTCVPAITGCGDGASLVNGICVPAITGCGNGAILVGNDCVPETKITGGNNGTCPCEQYCQKDWTGALKAAGWLGAVATRAENADNQTISVGVTDETALKCTCQRDDTRPFWRKDASCQTRPPNL